MRLTLRQWLNKLKPAGFAGLVAVAIMSAIVMAESGGVTNARNPETGTYPPTTRFPQGTYDRGAAQINSGWWPQFTDAQCDDPTETAKACWIISQGGTRWIDWHTYTNGAYVKFLPLRYRVLKHLRPELFGSTR